MAHELEKNEKGEARMFYAGTKPWHGLGTPVEREITSTAAMKLASLDWKVEKNPVYAQKFVVAILEEVHIIYHDTACANT